MTAPAPGPAVTRRRPLTWALCALMPVLGLAYQVAAKTTAESVAVTRFGPAWFVRLAHQPSLAALLAIEAVSFVAWMTVLAELPLSAAFPITAVGYVLIIAVSWAAFHEPASLLQLAGGAAILAGVWLIGRAGAGGTGGEGEA